MKKIPIIALLSVFTALSFTSCKKDFVCTCTINSNPLIGFDTTISFKNNISDRTKKQAEAECRGSRTAYQQLAAIFLSTADCTLEKD